MSSFGRFHLQENGQSLTGCCPNRFLTLLMSFPYFANVYPIEIIKTEFSLLMSYMQFCLIIGFGQQPVEL
jgi:hypothetical protein